MFTILRLIYTLFIILALPLIYFRLLLRSIKAPAYRQRLLERIGIYKNLDINPNGIWIHAVSVGEVVAAVPLIKALQSNYTELPILITTTTPTGAKRVQNIVNSASNSKNIQHLYMPYDISLCLSNLIKKVQPICLVIMETELWPNLLHICNIKHIPVIIANARLSDRSFPRYKFFSWVMAPILQQVTFVATQSLLDTERFVQLGLNINKIATVGNLKFEVPSDALQLQNGKNLKMQFGERLILIAASTHVGEEYEILLAFKHIQAVYRNSMLIIVPRHPERFDDVANMLAQQKINFVRYSDKDITKKYTAHTTVLLGDTMGELYMYYAAADVAFVGGSLVPVGGHNLLEPASLGLPCISGPYIENFKDISKLLVDAGLLQIVPDSMQLSEQCIAWFGASKTRLQLGNKAQQLILQHQGASKKIMSIICQYSELHTYP